ncbi:unnamed protein product, partial [Amoebophrya sp. A120]
MTSYRLYRNDELVNPLSNSITVQPTFTDYSISQHELTVSFSVAKVGRAWINVLLPEDVAKQRIATIKNGTDALGLSTCKRTTGGTMVVAVGSNTITLTNCNFPVDHTTLPPGKVFTLLIYVEGSKGLDDDGVISSPMNFTVPAPTASFIQSPILSDISKHAVVVEFEVSCSAGLYWLNIVVNTNRPLLTVET